MVTRFTSKGPVLVAVYLLLATLPLPLAMIGPLPPSRGFLVEFGIAIGFIALAMMGLQFALTARFPSLSTRFGQDVLLQFHRQAGLIAALLVLLHPTILIIADPRYALFFDPRVNAARAIALIAALLALAGVILLSIFRIRCRLRYEWWRLTHGLMASLVVFVGLVHTIRVGHYVAGWKLIPFALLVIAPLALLFHVRLFRPWRMRRRPCTVAQVRREGERTWTLVLTCAQPFRFHPGQFAWLTIAPTPLDIQQHPFTIASSAAEPHRLEFTIKELGDYTSRIGSIPSGATAFLDGPAGAFTLPDDAPGVVLICGGIGITPAMSILRTMKDRRDPRPAMLLYAAGSMEKTVFQGELQRLGGELDLRVSYILEHPPPGWTGPRGFITTDLLREQVPEPARRDYHFMICGPDAMMDIVERSLYELGVSRNRIRSERFNVI